MTQIPNASNRDAPQFNPVRFLEQLSNSQANGCLKVSHNSVEWRIYLNGGQLTYATHSIDPFDRLERHLRRLSQIVPILTSAVRQQVRQNFDREPQNDSALPPDYQAICWLVEQKYFKAEEANRFIKGLNQEVFESYLSLEAGKYEFNAINTDLRFLTSYVIDAFIEECQEQISAWQAFSPFISSPEQRPYFFSKAQSAQALSLDQQEKLAKLLRGFSFRQLAVLTNQDEIKVAQRLIPLIKSKAVVLRPPQPPFDRLPTIPAPASEALSKTNAIAANAGETLDSLPNVVAQKPYTIVCVDDSPTILKEINRFLEEHNLAVHAIANPTKALMEIVRIKPDMVLLDVGMPMIDGYKLCRLIRNHPLFQNTPIIMVTGNSGLIDRAKARVAGSTDYLTKPFTQTELIKMVFRYLT
jgi:twitching motility two-component system response regulator PilG